MTERRPPSRLRLTFAANLKRVRLREGQSQESLAHEGGFARAYLTAVESGRSNVSLDNVDRIARALKVNPIELFLDPSRDDAERPEAASESSAQRRRGSKMDNP